MPNKIKNKQNIKKISKKSVLPRSSNPNNYVTKSWLAKMLPNSSSNSAPAASSIQQSTTQAVIRQTSPVSTRIKHRELFTNITGQADFISTSYPINPGNNTLFPWLATQAKGWQKYRFSSLRIVYYTRTGTTTIGSLTMAVNRDSNEQAPHDDVEISAMAGAVEDAPWKTIAMQVDLTDHSPLFVRGPAQPANSDLKTYDFGVFLLAVSNGVNNTPWGRLWVEYDIELMFPVLLQVEDMGRIQSSVGLSAGVLFTGENDEGSNGISITRLSVTSVVAHGFENGLTYDVNFALFGTVLNGISMTTAPGTTAVTAPTYANNATAVYSSLFYRFISPLSGPIVFTFNVTATTVTVTVLTIARSPT
jgi:hypothetical protein